jgi:tape measure domain-containing protein
MSSPIEDFIVSLGFDTTKIKSQIQDLHKSLEKLAVGVDAKRVKNGLKAEKQISNNAVKVAETTAKKKEDIEKKSVKQSIALQDGHVKAQIKLQEKLAKQKAKDFNLVEKALQKTQKKALERQEALYRLNNKAKPSQNPSQSFIESAKRQQAVRALINPEQNPQLKAMGNYYRKMQSDQSALGIANERLRKRRSLGTLTNLQAFRDLKSSGPEGRQQALQALLSARQAARGGSLEKIKAIRASVIKLNRDLKESNVRVATLMTGPTGSATNNTFNAIKKGGGFQNYTSQQQASLLQGAQKQSTQKGADAFVRAARDVERYRPLGGAKIDAAIASGNIDQLRTVTKELSRMNHELEKQRRHSIGAAAAMSSLQDSTRNMVREYASLYALFAGTNAINQTGQSFEALNSAMLAATGNTSDAKQQMQFMIDLSRRLGLSVKDIADQYIKFKFAAKDKLATNQVEELFTNMSELGTVLGLSQEKMKLAFNAIQQMMSKVKISSEELRLQFSEAMPGGVQIFAKALGMSELEMFKLIESGQLMATDVLPKVAKQMKAMANTGGALDAKLQTVRVTQGQFTNELQLAQNKIFNSGYNKGLAQLFKNLTDTLGNNGLALERIGRIYDKVFRAIGYVISNIVTPAITFFIRSLETLWEVMKWGADNPMAAMSIAAVGMAASFRTLIPLAVGFGRALMVALKTPFAMITGMLAAIDEVRAIFDSNLIGVGESDKASQQSRDIAAAQARVRAGFGNEADKKFLSKFSSEQIMAAQRESGGIGSYLFGAAMSGEERVAAAKKAMPATSNFLDSYQKMLQAPVNLAKSAYDMMFNQTIIIQGDVNDEQIRRIGEESKKVMDNYGALQSVGVR